MVLVDGGRDNRKLGEIAERVRVGPELGLVKAEYSKSGGVERKVITATALGPYVNLIGVNLDKIVNVYGRRYLIEGDSPNFPKNEIGDETRVVVFNMIKKFYKKTRGLYPKKVEIEF